MDRRFSGSNQVDKETLLFKKVLIANRGEIALRVIRACRELDIQTVIVYSEADAESLPVKLADESVCVGPPQVTGSYLNIPSIISAAELTGAEAIHPGYGFLAENPQFAEIVGSCNMTFIGPNVDAIHSAGNKSNARAAMIKAGVPVTPGTENALSSEEEALDFAKVVSYPVIIKASAGGGGKGMRVAQNDDELRKMIVLAKNEAQAAFGNPEVYIEKYLEEPRHVEFQILADRHGNVVHLGERDCSIQRRHQKLLEESPSPALDLKLRSKMGEMAVKAAKALAYDSAGTIEFLVDVHHNYFFMEVNTRVQVEHPVTEMVSGIDIIKEQIKIAAGEKLSFSQNDVSLQGHAIEFRINSEDPDNDFMPRAGTISLYVPPGGPGVRVDSHLYTGYQIPPFYDSLLAKLIVWGKDREEAIARGKRALGEFIITGVPTTVPFHEKVLDNAWFRKGETYTNFVARRMLNE